MVEVGSPQDLSLVLTIVGAARTPFAVMSGGHASIPGFSSTRGVHISLKRFDQVSVSADGKTVTLGFGQVSSRSLKFGLAAADLVNRSGQTCMMLWTAVA